MVPVQFLVGISMRIGTAAKTSTTAFLAAAAASSGAFAADLGPPVKAPVLLAPAWDGWYVGGSVGGVWLNSTQDDTAAGTGARISGYSSSSVGTGGASQQVSNLAVMLGLQVGRN